MKLEIPENEILPVGLWSALVKKRANYTCEQCDRRKRVCAHHKDNSKLNTLENGRCLCMGCHRLTHCNRELPAKIVSSDGESKFDENPIKLATIEINEDIVVFSVRVPIEARARLKLLAIAKNITMSNLLAQMIAETWEKEGETLGSKMFAHKAGKEVRRNLGKL